MASTLKKIRLDTIFSYWQNRETLTISLSQLYRTIGFTKQNLHRSIARNMAYEEEINYLVLMIQSIRKDHPTLGLRAMYHKINPSQMGRGAFESMCREEGFSMPRKINYIRTTNSFGVVRFGNLLESRVFKNINEAWSSGITYYE